MKTFTRSEPTTVTPVGERFKQSVVVKHFQTDDGLTHEFTTFFAEDSCAAPVIALTSEGKVVMVYQFRAGPEAWLYDFPSGAALPGEDPEVAARRELAEETGYVPGVMHYLGDCHENGYINGKSPVFLATDCTYDPQVKQLDQTERDQGTQTRLVSIDELFTIAKNGELCLAGPFALAFEYLNNRRQEES